MNVSGTLSAISFLRDIFRIAGVMLTAADAEDAIHRVQSQDSPDFVVLDLRLPGSEGRETVRRSAKQPARSAFSPPAKRHQQNLGSRPTQMASTTGSQNLPARKNSLSHGLRLRCGRENELRSDRHGRGSSAAATELSLTGRCRAQASRHRLSAHGYYEKSPTRQRRACAVVISKSQAPPGRSGRP